MKVNLGSGGDYREGYINVDFSDVDSSGNPIKVDKKCNFITDELPFEDDSVDEVIFRECLEHTNRWNSVKVLEKIYKIMKSGALLDLSVPNARIQMAKLLAQMNQTLTWDDFIHAHERWTYFKWHDDLAGGTSESDGFDGMSHKTFFSKNALIMILEHVGFKIEEFIEDSSFYVKARK